MLKMESRMMPKLKRLFASSECRHGPPGRVRAVPRHRRRGQPGGRRPCRSPPAVTRILADLERRLGVRLVERTTRRLAVTDAGLRLAEHARRLVAAYKDAISD